MKTSTNSSSLADILERVLDKGIVIAGDVTVSVGSVELLSIRIRLLVASVDKAKEIGIDWWESDPHLSSRAKRLETENRFLAERLAIMEQELQQLRQLLPQATGVEGDTVPETLEEETAAP
ncbi:MAG: gas vesicle protein [Pseudanabaenaceae cyanobacterium]